MYVDLSKANVRGQLDQPVMRGEQEIGVWFEAFTHAGKKVYVGLDTVCNHGPFVADTLQQLTEDMGGAMSMCDSEG